MAPTINTLNGYQTAMTQFVKGPVDVSVRDRNNFDIIHAAFGLASEVGEIADAMKRDMAYGKPYDPVNLMEEAGDILWYVSLLCNGLGITLQQCAEMNIAKLLERREQAKLRDSIVDKTDRDTAAERAAMQAVTANA